MRRSELDNQRSIAISICEDRNVTVTFDEKAETAYSDSKSLIVLSPNVIPENLRKYPKLMQTILDGETIHEATHIVKTGPMLEDYNAWLNAKGYRNLAHAVMNIIEDKRVNTHVRLKDPYHYGKRLATLYAVMAETLLPFPASKNHTFYRVTNGIIQKSLFGILRIEKPTEKEKTLIDAACEIVESAKYANVPSIQFKDSIIGKADALYALLEDAADSMTNNNLPENTQNVIEFGKLTNTGATSSEFEEKITVESGDKPKPSTNGAGEGEQEKEAKSKNGKTGKDVLGKLRGMAAGKGAGLDIPAPQPNWVEYERLVAATRREVQRLLNLLKRIQTITWKKAPFQRTGRFMTEIIGKAYAQSQVRPARDVFQRMQLQTEKQKVALGLIVDLSGSMSLEMAKQVLTILTEVCGMWLRDEDWSFLVFGSNFIRTKVFVEPYHNTRGRIGGLGGMGGTEMFYPVQAMHRMFRTTNGKRRKFCIIYSDFETDLPAETKREIQGMMWDGVRVIGVVPNKYQLQSARSFTPNVTAIENISQLPEAFFEIYSNAALRPIRKTVT